MRLFLCERGKHTSCTRKDAFSLFQKKIMSNWKFKPKLYPHFDKVLKKQKIEVLVKNPEKIAQHSFLPFIEAKQQQRKLKGSKKKTRPIKYASHTDSQVFSYYRDEIINNKYEKKLSQLGLTNNVIAYRKIPSSSGKGKCNIHFAKEAFDKVISMDSCVALTFDISGFFESLNHDFLKKKLKEVLEMSNLPKDYEAVLKSLTNYSVVQHNECYESLGLIKKEGDRIKYLHCPKYIFRKKKTLCSKDTYRGKIISKGLVKKNNDKKGIPQGASLSDVLANIYMLDFDKKMQLLEQEIKGYYRRYSDDILWICSKEKYNQVETTLNKAIETLCGDTLRLSKTKTTKTYFKKTTSEISSEGDKFEYLGFRFDGKKAGSSQKLEELVNRKKIFHLVFYRNKNLKKRELYGNFMNYVERAKKIFNQKDNREYSLSNKQLSKNKKWIHRKIDEEIRNYSI